MTNNVHGGFSPETLKMKTTRILQVVLPGLDGQSQKHKEHGEFETSPRDDSNLIIICLVAGSIYIALICITFTAKFIISYFKKKVAPDPNDVKVVIREEAGGGGHGEDAGVGANWKGDGGQVREVHHVPNYKFEPNLQKIKFTKQEHREHVQSKFEQWQIRNYLQEIGIVVPNNVVISQEEFQAYKE